MDDALLEQALDDAIDDGWDSDNDDGSTQKHAQSDLPDSFCSFSASDEAGHFGRQPPVPQALQGNHITATLQVGDVLYLPASWFHEVISSGADDGGHLALNIWMAPPCTNGNFKD